jgi:hypothetical protein
MLRMQFSPYEYQCKTSAWISKLQIDKIPSSNLSGFGTTASKRSEDGQAPNMRTHGFGA